MDKGSHSLTICQRLIRFIERAMPHGSFQVPIEDGKSRNEKGWNRLKNTTNGHEGSEIVVEFRHTRGPERQTDTNKHEEKFLASMKDGTVFGEERKRRMNYFGSKVDQKNFTDQAKIPNNRLHNEATKPRDMTMSPMRVASNINEKSDEYIKSRKKAMNRNYSLDTETQ